MKRFGLSLMAGGLLCLSGGCYKNTYMTGLPPSGVVSTHHAQFFIYGLVGEETFDMDAICPQGVAWFQNRMEVMDWAFSCLTCALYTPLTVEVRCASGQAWLAVPDEQERLTWIYELPTDVEPTDLQGGAL